MTGSDGEQLPAFDIEQYVRHLHALGAAASHHAPLLQPAEAHVAEELALDPEAAARYLEWWPVGEESIPVVTGRKLNAFAQEIGRFSGAVDARLENLLNYFVDSLYGLPQESFERTGYYAQHGIIYRVAVTRSGEPHTRVAAIEVNTFAAIVRALDQRRPDQYGKAAQQVMRGFTIALQRPPQAE